MDRRLSPELEKEIHELSINLTLQRERNNSTRGAVFFASTPVMTAEESERRMLRYILDQGESEFTEFMCLIICDKMYSGRERILTRDMLTCVLTQFKKMTMNRIMIIAGHLPEPERSETQCYLLDVSDNSTICHADHYSLEVHSHKATMLKDGMILVTGGLNDGWSTSKCSVFDFVFKHWPAMVEPRHGHGLVTLNDGRAFVFGGKSWTEQRRTSGTESILDSIEYFCTRFYQWKEHWVMMLDRRYLFAAVVLTDGRVLLSGGIYKGKGLATCMIFDPVKETFVYCASMNSYRCNHCGILLPCGRVLVTGGSVAPYANGLPIASATCEMYDPISDTWTAAAPMRHAREHHCCVLLATCVMVFGGKANVSEYSARVELFMLDDEKWHPSTIICRNTFAATATVLRPYMKIKAEK